MLYNLYQFIHNSLGLCFWDLPALLVGIIMIVVFAVRQRNQKKRQNNFEDELEEKMKAIKEGTAGEEPSAGITTKAVAAVSIRRRASTK